MVPRQPRRPDLLPEASVAAKSLRAGHRCVPGTGRWLARRPTLLLKRGGTALTRGHVFSREKGQEGLFAGLFCSTAPTFFLGGWQGGWSLRGRGNSHAMRRAFTTGCENDERGTGSPVRSDAESSMGPNNG